MIMASNHRLIIILPPLQGHMTPMLQLATILYSKGFSITVLHTKFNSPDPTNHPDFIFVPFHDGLSDSYTVSSKNFIHISSHLNTNCVTPLKKVLVKIIKEEKISCVIYDGLMHFIDSVARELNLPTILFRTTCATNYLSYHWLSMLQRNGYLPLQDSNYRCMEMVEGLEPLRFKDLPIFNLGESATDIMVKQATESLLVKPSLGVIFNTIEFLESSSLQKLRKLYKVGVFPIGPLHMCMASSETQEKNNNCSTSLMKADYSCITWLNEQEPCSVLYVSLGSIASWEEKELIEVAYGLRNSEQRFLWVIRPETIESIPEEVKSATRKKGRIVTWAPQREVLAHRAVGGFWSHCGWNSTLESVCFGVPMMCQPCFGDQRVNARLVSNVWKVGIECSEMRIRRDEVEGAVRRMMVSEEGKLMRERAVLMKNKIKIGVRDNDVLNGIVHAIVMSSSNSSAPRNNHNSS
ncbi:UDP-glucose iridoid glucosyltransferase-like [Arachis stenosperma]|uniref:UDP-glucose iridoid glucosyltransferase-like n=1 Tax=Arachis stenosperma TaxID=217475 RepID=UPI0025AD8E91|nr:UDP-glucose iridoid glucosyltransferase-like [Arachis stenosperma]